MRSIVLSFLLISFKPIASAEELDKASQEALSQTQQLLTNLSERKEAVNKDPKAKAADSMVDQAIGFEGENKDAVYQLASEVFADLVKQTGGDGKKMQELISDFKRDPAAFAEKWSPEQKAKLKAIADKVGPQNSTGH